ncbi:MAG TPA: reverse transcriptase domain-containing protein [Ktedonobacteraceae bacterium]
MARDVTEETPDGIPLVAIETIIEALRYERYQWQPTRRMQILRNNGQKRPLGGMPGWSDRLLQEAIRLLLQAYYEPRFSEYSHGFRPDRGCHTALREVSDRWKGTTWFIEGDISGCFHNLNHELILSTLSTHIHDGRFLGLIRELLEAGYLEEWTMKKTLSGVPQGGIISPILANILLDKLDVFVETTLIPHYTRGEERRANLEYMRLNTRSHDYRQRGQLEKARKLRQRAQSLPSMDVKDPDYRRLRYVRYADDFLFGFIGPRSEAEEISQALGRFLQEELRVELLEAKTLITHARTEAAKFLGYEISTIQQDRKQGLRRSTTGVESKCRTVSGKIGLRVPREVIEAKCQRYMRNGKALRRSELEHASDFAIIALYQSEYRGIANYYRLAYNMHTLKRLKWVMENSLVRTLAHKLQVSLPRVYEQYGAELMVDGRKYQVVGPTRKKTR